MKIRIIAFITLFVIYNPLLITPAYADVKIGNEFGFGYLKSLGQITNSIIMPIFSFVAAVVVIFFLFGAFKYIIAGADKEKVAQARQTIIHSIIGFIILMFAFFILQFIPQFLELPGLDIIK